MAPSATAVMQTYNQDILGMVTRIDDFIVELVNADSSGVHDMSAADQSRLSKYIESARFYLKWSTQQPVLDLAESSSLLYDLPAAPTVPPIENSAIQDCIRLWEAARSQLVNSQSARRKVGLYPFDLDRVMGVIDRLESLLVDYIANVLPLDLPKSSPEVPMTTGGRQGV